jgi:hypothetical protein
MVAMSIAAFAGSAHGADAKTRAYPYPIPLVPYEGFTPNQETDYEGNCGRDDFPFAVKLF